MKSFVGLLKRELREHPALYVAPLGINLFFAVSALILIARAIGSTEMLRNIVAGIDLADPAAFEAGRNAFIASPIAFLIVVTIAVGFFYFLDCLYAERKERTILFFKSFPVSDWETVLSKLVCGVVLLPALSLIAFAITQVFILIVASIAMAFADGSVGGLWSIGGILSNWAFVFYVLLSCALWYLPFIGYLLLVSSWAKRATLLWAILPGIVMHAEWLLPGPAFFTPLVLRHLGGYPGAAYDIDGIASFEGESQFSQWFAEQGFNPLALADPLGLVATPALWGGLVIGAALITAAVYLRRYRDDS